MNLLPLAFALALAAIVTGMTGCAPSSGPDPSELLPVAKLASPDGRLVAYHVQDISGGPAVGVSEDIYVLSRPGKLRFSDRVFTMECLGHLKMTWTDPSTLMVSYDTGDGYLKDNGVHYGWWGLGKKPTPAFSVHILRRVYRGETCYEAYQHPE